VQAINNENQTSTAPSAFESYLATELESAECIILLRSWSHHSRYLVLISPRLAMCENASRFSVCSVSGKKDSDKRRVYCDSVRCKRGKNNKVKTNSDRDVCCHLKQLIQTITDDSQLDDTFTYAAAGVLTSDSGKKLIPT
jgi:hypothetical protein